MTPSDVPAASKPTIPAANRSIRRPDVLLAAAFAILMIVACFNRWAPDRVPMADEWHYMLDAVAAADRGVLRLIDRDGVDTAHANVMLAPDS